MTAEEKSLDDYLEAIVRFNEVTLDRRKRTTLMGRFKKALSLLPEDVLKLFLSKSRRLSVTVMADTILPMGMATRTEGTPRKPRYTIVVYAEHADWPEDRFIGAFLRELAHVVAERPREDKWPAARADRARFKEQLEHSADAMVWRWGLRHYSMSYLVATFPEHWVERIVTEIERTLREEAGDKVW